MKPAPKSKGVAIIVGPNVEAHDDPGRVIGRRTTCHSKEHAYLHGYTVVIVAVLKDALRQEEGGEYLTTEEAVRAAGGVGPYDRVEVAPILKDGRMSFVTSDPRAVDVQAFAFLQTIH